MTFIKNLKLNISILCLAGLVSIPAGAYNSEYYGVQEAWENPNANMTAGSLKPGYAQLNWSAGSVLPIKLRNGMVTMINLPNGEKIADAIVGDPDRFQIDATQGDRTMFLAPEGSNQGSDTNMIVTGESGNKYIFYLQAQPSNASEITYSQVDIILDNNAMLPVAGGKTSGTASAARSIFKKASSGSNTVGVDGQKGFINATDLADYLVKKGLPFRSAYKISGQLVALCIRENIVLEELPLETYRSYSPLFDEDLYPEIALQTCVEKRISQGGTCAASVKAQITYVKEILGL